MGLSERRIATDFQTNHYPALEKRIHDAAGFSVPIEVRWDTLSDKDPRYSHGWIEGWPKVYFAPIVEAFTQITRDEMGKAALKAALKKIVVQDTTTTFSSYWASFDKSTGVLTLDHQFSNQNLIQDRVDNLIKELEKHL